MAGIHCAGNGLPSLFRKYAAIIIFFPFISSDKTKTAPILIGMACWSVLHIKQAKNVYGYYVVHCNISLSLSRKK